ncbi:MAG: Holliday junction branch migration protein RuvA [Methanomicrobiales archaeon]|nr:Holliday junction branch migration protein RuvA [Methanomicrobiales archaeon]NYT20825.1 Holliday junction branch migration protein RuvA [Methanomicrobiales archaeon]
MISQLSGQVISIREGSVILDVNGVGFEVRMTGPELRELAGAHGTIRVHTFLAVREDELVLYGFLHPTGLGMFRMLISVTRVGPALALSILSQISIPGLAAAILDEDEKVLVRISGIGQKNAKRLILELKDKLRKKAAEFEGATPAGTDPVRRDAVSALVALGFGERESRTAVDQVLSSGTASNVASVIKAALAELREH